MSRFTTPRSFYNDLKSGNEFDCDDDLREPIMLVLKKVATVLSDGKERWPNVAVLDVIDKVMATFETLLFDSDEVTLQVQKTRERVLRQVVLLKIQIETRQKIKDVLKDRHE